MPTDKTEIAVADIYAAMQVALTWKLHALCGGDDSYLGWTEKKFPPVY